MLLDDLVAVIETLKERIQIHGASLRENEYRTRLALIDPLLRVLGWDVSDPAMVTPEYDLSGQKADYALLSGGNKPAALVEAKRLGESLTSHRMQMVNYANMSGVSYAGLTDGSHWELYRVFDPAPIEDRLILNLSIANTPAYQCALKLLLLWRPNLESEQPTEANTPVLTGTLEAIWSAPVPTVDDGISAPVKEVSESVFPKPKSVSSPTIREQGWRALSEIHPKAGDSPPLAIRFPDEGERSLKSAWVALVEETVAWLWSKKLLTSDNVPVPSSRKRYIVNTEQSHQEKEFNQGKRIKGTPLWIEANIGCIAAAANAKKLLERGGVRPEGVYLRL